jgi:hypothetical protein
MVAQRGQGKTTMAQALGRPHRSWACAALAVLVATGAASLAPAAPLDAQTCDQLKREVVDLERLGARESLQKGAAWGKANLRSAQLEQVRKLIEMDEAIAFRCPRPKPQPDPAVAAGAAGAAGVAGAAAVAKARPGTKAGVKSGTQSGTQAGTKAGQGSAAALVKPAPRPRPKPQGATAAAPGSTAGAPPAGTPATQAAKPKPKPAQPTSAAPRASDAYVAPRPPAVQ